MAPGRGALRLTRVALFALAAVGLASAAHAAGGERVSVPVALLAVPAVMIVVHLLAGRQRGITALLPVMAGTQLALHVALMAGSLGRGCQIVGNHAMALMPGHAATAAMSGTSVMSVTSAMSGTSALSGAVTTSGAMTTSGALASSGALPVSGRLAASGAMSMSGSVGIGAHAGFAMHCGAAMSGGVLGGWWPSVPMLIAHALATVLLAVLLAHGESALWALAGWLGFSPRPAVGRPFVLPSRRRLPVAVATAFRPRSAVPRTTVRRRGPPSPACAAC